MPEKNLPFRECLSCDMQEHRFAKTLDHPDGSVTYEKLSPGVQEKLNSVGVFENFIAEYRTTTWEELNEAYNAGKHIYAKAGTNIYVLFSISQTTATFSRAQQTSIDYVRVNSQSVWTSSSQEIVSKEDFDALAARVAALEGE